MISRTPMCGGRSASLPFTASLPLYHCPLNCPSLPFTALHCPSLPFTALHCPSLLSTAFHCPSLPFTAFHRPSTAGFGNGMLFATMLILLLDYEVQASPARHEANAPPQKSSPPVWPEYCRVEHVIYLFIIRAGAGAGPTEQSAVGRVRCAGWRGDGMWRNHCLDARCLPLLRTPATAVPAQVHRGSVLPCADCGDAVVLQARGRTSTESGVCFAAVSVSASLVGAWVGSTVAVRSAVAVH